MKSVYFSNRAGCILYLFNIYDSAFLIFQGRKIFYVARPTPENLEVYKKYETDVNVPKEWIGKKLFSEFQRVEIKKGETAMIPSGYLHFVYTPEDSLVIGGNFLMEKYLKWQFE